MGAVGGNWPADSGAVPADSVDVHLADYRWQHRVLLVFTPAREADAYRDQMRQWADRDPGFAERDLLRIEIAGEVGGRLGENPLTVASARRLRSRFEVPPSAFRVVLIGKDGTEKRRDDAPVSASSLFDTIDAMPMRQREMRENDGGRG